MSEQGHLVLFLHAHLPYVREAQEGALAENWLYEAITETYMPLLAVAEGWLRDGIRARLTVSLSPPLLEMLRDDLLQRRYISRTGALLELAEAEVRRTACDERFRFTAGMYRDRIADARERFQNRYSRDLVAAFGALQEAGVLEIVTSCATHAFLPCFDTGYARAQIRIGVKAYHEHFSRDPPGIWLPECGFVPGIDRLVAAEGVGYFFTDSHALEFADPPAVFGTYSPVVCPSGVVAFARDRDSSAQVWSAEWGYPGDGRYREFYRDIGDNTGLKFYRVTGRDVPLHEKEPYHRGWALEAVDQHAAHFVQERQEQIYAWASAMGRPAVVAAPYDAELFGHWWFEGPEFLDMVARKAACNQQVYTLSTPTDVMDSGLEFQAAMPAASSWGAYGYSDTWLNDHNHWIWPPVHRAVATMRRLARAHPVATDAQRRALNQLARETLLATSSDWPFIMTMGTMVPYAEDRVRAHIGTFHRLAEQITAGDIDEGWLAAVEARHPIFRNIDYTYLGGHDGDPAGADGA